VKIDLIFDQPHAALPPPWQVTASTLAGIDDHFWDWALWLWSKPAAGRRDVLAAELSKLHRHLLSPLGVGPVPGTHHEAIREYRTARAGWERRFGIQLSRVAEQAVAPAFDT